jgi:hypothetical protein
MNAKGSIGAISLPIGPYYLIEQGTPLGEIAEKLGGLQGDARALAQVSAYLDGLAARKEAPALAGAAKTAEN